MVKFRFFSSLLSLILLMVFLSACEKEMDKYYEVPTWLKGNAWEVLEQQGDYSYFLQAVDRAGYKDMISGRGIITVIAPTNSAFSNYLEVNGQASIDDIPLEELKELVGFHLVYYSFDKQGFANYRPDGVSTKADALIDAGLYYKFRTKSSSGFEEFVDHTVSASEVPPVRKVYHKERFLPVLSNYLFNTKSIDAQRNYQYFFPNKDFTSDINGFNISNASVLDYAIIADNGYVYTVDEVLKPVETIYDAITRAGDYSLFQEAYDRFAEFQYSAELTENYGAGDSLFLFYHTDLPKIASEWSYNGERGVPDYADLATLARLSNNVFAPSNTSLTNFFNSFWGGYYTNLNEVPFLSIKYLLDNHVFEGDVIFPEDVEKGAVVSRYGDPIKFDVNATAFKTLCANGTFYGLNSVIVPRMFQSVTAPVFQQPQFSMFLHMIDQVSKVQPLMTDNIEFSLFLPSNQILEDNTTIQGKPIQYQNLNPNRFGEQSIQIEGDDDPWVYMNYSTMNGLVNNHIATKLMSEVDEFKIYKTLNNFQYLLVEDDEKIYSSNIFNNYPDRPASFAKISDYYNGTTFELTGDEDMALVQDYSLFKDQIKMNTPPNLTLFKQLLDAGGLPNTSPAFSFLQGERFILFASEEDAIMRDFVKLPSLLPDFMGKYMKIYFISLNESGLSDYPFPGAGIEGILKTFAYTASGQRISIQLVDKGDSLEVIDPKGNKIAVTSIFPKIYADGAVYMIDGLMEME